MCGVSEPDGVMGVAPGVLAAMQRLALETRTLLGLRAAWHVGDLAWNLRRRGGRERGWRISLRSEGDELVAWSWLREDNGRLEHDVHPQHMHLLDELLADPRASSAFAFEEDPEKRAVLERRGFREPGEAMHFMVCDLIRPPDQPEVPPGFRCRTVEHADVAERVDVHRDVWAPSDLTESSYAGVRTQWPYRATLDCVVEAPDSRFAAYALLWPDDDHGVGELEPVGVRDEYRRRGLGTAVCRYAMRRWHEEGGRQAIVYCDTEPACALYESLGFRRHATLREYIRR